MLCQRANCPWSPPLQEAGTAHRRGAAVIEFALVVPIIFLLVFGVIELGRWLMVQHLMHNAARVGCRTAIVGTKTTAEINKVTTDYLNDVRVEGATVTVTVNDLPTDTILAKAGDRITVSVAAPTDQNSWIPFLQYTNSTTEAEFTLRRE